MMMMPNVFYNTTRGRDDRAAEQLLLKPMLGGPKISPLHDRTKSPLHVAALTGDEEELSRLIATGVAVDAVRFCDDSGVFGLTAIMDAAAAGHVTCIDALVRAGADVNHGCDSHGSTPIMAAVFHGHTGCIDALVRGGADVNPRASTSPIATVAAWR